MNGLPLHPALVHLPLALAVLVPLVALIVTLLAWRRAPTRALLSALVLAQALLVASGFAARAAGESDEDLVEAVVPEAALEAHEEGSGVFVYVAVGVLVVLVGAWAATSRPRVARVALTLGALGTIGVAVLGLGVGHSGGELIYRYGAARAHQATAAPNHDAH